MMVKQMLYYASHTKKPTTDHAQKQIYYGFMVVGWEIINGFKLVFTAPTVLLLLHRGVKNVIIVT